MAGPGRLARFPVFLFTTLLLWLTRLLVRAFSLTEGAYDVKGVLNHAKRKDMTTASIDQS